MSDIRNRSLPKGAMTAADPRIRRDNRPAPVDFICPEELETLRRLTGGYKELVRIDVDAILIANGLKCEVDCENFGLSGETVSATATGAAPGTEVEVKGESLLNRPCVDHGKLGETVVKNLSPPTESSASFGSFNN